MKPSRILRAARILEINNQALFDCNTDREGKFCGYGAKENAREFKLVKKLVAELRALGSAHKHAKNSR